MTKATSGYLMLPIRTIEQAKADIANRVKRPIPLDLPELPVADIEVRRAEFMRRATHRIKPFPGPSVVIIESTPT